MGVTPTGFAKAPGWREPRPRAYRYRAPRRGRNRAGQCDWPRTDTAISSPRAVPDPRQKQPAGFIAGDTPLRLGAGHAHRSAGGRGDDVPGPLPTVGRSGWVLRSRRSGMAQHATAASLIAAPHAVCSICRVIYRQGNKPTVCCRIAHAALSDCCRSPRSQ